MPFNAPGSLTAPQPVPPVRRFSFTDWQVNQPTAPPPGDRLDGEFDSINNALSDTIAWTGRSLNTDGSLRSGVVGKAQLVPGLFAHVTETAVADLQLLIDKLGVSTTSTMDDATSASISAAQAAASASDAAAGAVAAETALRAAETAASDAQGYATNAQDAASFTGNAANHASGFAAVGQAYADVSLAWAEHMPDTIPPNILAVMGVTGNHWSSRWWASQAAIAFSQISGLIAQAPPQATTYDYTYVATAGQTVFTGTDFFGKTLAYTPGPTQSLSVHENGVLRTPVSDYTSSANTMTMTTPCQAGDIVRVWVNGVAPGQYLPLSGGTMTGPLTLSADPVAPMHAVTKRYVDLGFLPFSGGVLTGPLTLAADPVNAMQPVTRNYADTHYLALSGGILTGPVTLAADPAGPLQPVTRQYADGKYLTFNGGTLTGFLTLVGDPGAPLHAVTKRYVDAGFLPLIGGILTGPLVLAGPPTAPNHPATKNYVDTKPPLGGPYLPLSGGAMQGGLTLANDPLGDMQAATKRYVDQHLVASIDLSHLPTDSIGLPSGAAWNNGTFVCIVP